MAGAIWGGDGAFMAATEHQLMNPSIWGPGDPSGPPPSAPHWGLPPAHHPPAGPPPNAFQQPASAFPAPHFPGKSPWDGPAWHPAPAPHPNVPNGWGNPHAASWAQQPPQQSAAHGSHGHGHGRHGGSSMHGHSQPPNSAPPHGANLPPGSNSSFQWSNAQPPFGGGAANTANKSFAETVQSGAGRGVMGPGPGPRGPPFDPAPGWGAPPGAPVKVNQGVPWDVGSGQDSSKEWDTKGTGHWGEPGAGGPNSGHHPSGWGAGPGQGGGGGGNGGGGEWQNPRDNGTGMWNQGGNPAAHPPGNPGASWAGPHQGPPPGRPGGHPVAPWEMQQQQQEHRGEPPRGQAAAPWDPRGERGPSDGQRGHDGDNMWIPPGPMETNNDMVWHDPNPKSKKPVIDKGTGHWGDPTDSKWGDIKRWKDGGEDVIVSSAWAGSPLAPSMEAGSQSAAGTPSTATAPAPVSKSASTPGTGWGEPTRPAGGEWGGNGEDWAGAAAKTESESTEAKPANFAENPNLRDLTAQIAEQLRVAVDLGLINMNILGKPLPQNVLHVLNNLLQRVPKLETASKELDALKTSPNAAHPSIQLDVIAKQMEVKNLRQEIHDLQSQIDRSTVTDGREGSGSVTPGDGGSKLSLWKTDDKAKLSNANSTPNLGDLADTLSGMGLGGGSDPWGAGRMPGLDWADKANGDSKSETGSLKKGGSGGNSSSATPTPNADINLKEFVPGKKWVWQDPKEVADDPNATPGSLKPNPLSVGSNLANSAPGSSSFGGLSGNTTPTKMIPMTTAAVSPSMSSAIWGGPGGRGGINSMAGNGRAPPMNRSVSSPVGPQSAFQPFAPSYVVLSNTGGVPEANLRAVASKAGNLQNFLAHQGHQIALLKYADNLASDNHVLPRLQGELAQFGVKVQTADEGQVASLMGMVGGGGGGGAMRSGAPTPNQLWSDSTPSTTAPGAWGAPPFAGTPSASPLKSLLPPSLLKRAFKRES